MLKIFELFKRRRYYCQECGNEITELGGYVSGDGRIFCVHENMMQFYIASMKDKLSIEYHTRKELKEDVKSRKLVHFGKLEDIIKG